MLCPGVRCRCARARGFRSVRVTASCACQHAGSSAIMLRSDGRGVCSAFGVGPSAGLPACAAAADTLRLLVGCVQLLCQTTAGKRLRHPAGCPDAVQYARPCDGAGPDW